MLKADPHCCDCRGRGIDMNTDERCWCVEERGIKDAELVALAALVQATALGCHAEDLQRIKCGCEPNYNGTRSAEYAALETELKRRGVLR